MKTKIITIIKWIIFIILIGMLAMGVLYAIKKYDDFTKLKSPGVTIPRKVEVTIEKEVPKWRDRLVYNIAPPETVYLDTVPQVIENRPWGIVKLCKNGDSVVDTAIRPCVDIEQRTYITRADIYKLKYSGKEFSILSTGDPNNPFYLKEKREFVKFQMGGGISSANSIFVKAGAYYPGVQIKKIKGMIGISAYISFLRSDMSVEFIAGN